MYETMDDVAYEDEGRRVRLVKRLPLTRSAENANEESGG